MESDTLTFDARGLVTAVAQDAASGEVLMVAHMNQEALARTLATGEIDVEYRISVTCAAADEAQRACPPPACGPLTLRGVRAHRNPGSDTVRIEMMVMSEGANHRPVEQLTSRLSLEPSVSSKALERDGVLAGA